MSDIFTPTNVPFDPGVNWCPDCGLMRGVCACEEMRANNPNGELDDWGVWDGPDEEWGNDPLDYDDEDDDLLDDRRLGGACSGVGGEGERGTIVSKHDLCCICGDDACDELWQGSPVCQMHFGMLYSGYTLDELRAERDAEDSLLPGTPEYAAFMSRMVAGQAAVELPVEELESEYVRLAVENKQLAAERDAALARAEKVEALIAALSKADDYYVSMANGFIFRFAEFDQATDAYDAYCAAKPLKADTDGA